MPLEGLEEEGLPKNPDLSLAQLKFLFTVEEVNKEAIWSQLLTAIKENGKTACNIIVLCILYNLRIAVFLSFGPTNVIF